MDKSIDKYPKMDYYIHIRKKEAVDMNVDDLKKLKKEAGLTNEEISELSSVPVSTVNKIFSGATQNPRYATLLAIEQVLVKKEKLPFTYNEIYQEPMVIQEEVAAYRYSARKYEEADIEKLSEFTRAELIDGKLYVMATPNRIHQYLSMQISFQFHLHIKGKNGKCHVYTAPFGVRLFDDARTYVQPDISVICRKDIMDEKGCQGAPDLVVEIVSPSNASHDYITKMVQYQKAGVREYWIVDPEQHMTTVVNFENAEKSNQYTFEETIVSGLLEGLEIQISELLADF